MINSSIKYLPQLLSDNRSVWLLFWKRWCTHRSSRWNTHTSTDSSCQLNMPQQMHFSNARILNQHCVAKPASTHLTVSSNKIVDTGLPYHGCQVQTSKTMHNTCSWSMIFYTKRTYRYVTVLLKWCCAFNNVVNGDSRVSRFIR